MTDTWTQLSSDMAAVVEHAGQFTVRVEGRRRLPATGIVWSGEGVIVSALHVVTREENLRIGLPDGSAVAADLVGSDPSTDLIVLKAAARDLAVPQWTASDDLRVGHLVLALGRPGRTVQATLGVVSAVGGEWTTAAGGQVDRYLQTDVVMYPGFSGGPLVGAGGAVLGLNSSVLARGASVSLPAGTVTRVVNAILEHGHVQRGYLGVGAQPVRLPQSLADTTGQETGLLLVSVEPESPAGEAGLLLGDTIVSLDGQPVPHMDALQALLSGDRVGRAVPLRVIRGGELIEVRVTIGAR